MGKKLLYSLSNNKLLTKEVADILKIDIAISRVVNFNDGEIIVENDTPVKGKDVYVIQSTSKPVTQSLFELLVFVDGLKRASANKITAIIPYFGYARQDRINKAQEPITARLVADMLTLAGVDKVVCFDLHAGQVQGFFSCPLEDLNAADLFADYFKDTFDLKNLVIVSPDHGGATRARDLAKLLKTKDVALIDKHRNASNQIDYMNLIGDVQNKDALIIDDIIDTGSTLVKAVETLRQKGALSVTICATHGVFSNDSLEKLKAANVKEIVITNTIEHNELPPFIKVLNVAKLIAKSINES